MSHFHINHIMKLNNILKFIGNSQSSQSMESSNPIHQDANHLKGGRLSV